MAIIWLGLLTEVFILTLLKPTIRDFELISVAAVCLHIFYTVICLIVMKDRPRGILLVGFTGRCLLLFWDIYARGIFMLPNSGADSEMYDHHAVAVSEYSALFAAQINGGLYSKLMGALFMLIGPQRLMAQYINVLLGLSMLMVIYDTLKLLDMSPKTVKKTLHVAALFPNAMILSAIFLREILPAFLVACSVFFLVKWYISGKSLYMWISFLLLGLGGLFHSGVLSLFFGYAFLFILYDTHRKTWRFNHKSILAFFVISAVAILSASFLGDVLFGKFQGVEAWEDLYTVANRRAGDSRYLTGLQIQSPGQIILFGPVKAVFFLFSPLPVNWRGLMDVFTFFFDSMLYLVVVVQVVKWFKRLKSHKPLLIASLLMIATAVFVFGIGVSNAGTAMRHRQKILPIFLLLLAVTDNEKRDLNEEVIIYEQRSSTKPVDDSPV